MFYHQNFFLFQMFFIRLFLANARKKIGCHRVCLFPHKLPWKVDIVFRSQSAVRIENFRGRDWDETQNGAHRLRSLLTISSLFSVVFMCLILPTLKCILEKSAKIAKNEVSQDLMRFYSYEPSIFFALGQ